ncbi:MAG: hypothetical protein M1835_005167 [Candelina submexicana]|nr:MAG: hypothetical protein M1835_005167 [Candelina submexicana]
MHAAPWRALQPVPKLRCCRFVAGCRRFPIATRSFHRSAIAYRSSGDPAGSSDSAEARGIDDTSVGDRGDATSAKESEGTTGTAVEDDPQITQKDPSRDPSKDPNSSYGSATRRANRNKKLKEIPQPLLPPWWYSRHVKLKEDLQELEMPELGQASDLIREVWADAAISDQEKVLAESSTVTSETESLSHGKVYKLPYEIFLEICATARAGFRLPPEFYADSFPGVKTNILLHCPKDGGIYFLDKVVNLVASATDADVVQLDAQDIAEFGGDYLGEGAEPSPYSIRSLGYDSQHVVARTQSREYEDEAEDPDDPDNNYDHDIPFTQGLPGMTVPSKGPKIITIKIEDMLKTLPIASGSPLSAPRAPSPFAKQSSNSTDQWNDLKLSALVETFVDAAQGKTEALNEEDISIGNGEPLTSPAGVTYVDSGPTETTANSTVSSRNLIIMVRDYKEIRATIHGHTFLQRLDEIIRKRRKEGQKVIIIGTVSSADLTPGLSKSSIRALQSERENKSFRTIVVTPLLPPDGDVTFFEDEKRRMVEINMRNLQDMMLRLSSSDEQMSDIMGGKPLRIGSAQEFASGLHESVWSFDRIHRVAIAVLGLMPADAKITPVAIERLLRLLDASDDVKFKWAAEEREFQSALDVAPVEKVGESAKQRQDKLKRLRKTCNTHEKKLLNGVVDPENIHTTFADVHTPPETVEALKTLTSLSLIRPEAFSYGVLATDKIPGLLLYGPPGTGKTLLAKATAKESGATVLEVSGSEVYDMYVGEGEKNVKAIFTLAKKLAPCVVFIDEADAIFGSRSGSSSNRTSHRELINQFLREWDGMDDLSAFIMVATNRPFDLDDAVLRRLPRRLLVDLPVEKDREAILKIHLRDEILDSSVSLASLASQTPLYSGSDLKNVSVAAALACVREENEEAAKHTGTEPYQFSEKRTLLKRHFDKAIEEVSASVSEDMSTLAAIKKFDEKYGDRRGRRKKMAGYGFATAVDAEKHAETGRVRN